MTIRDLFNKLIEPINQEAIEEYENQMGIDSTLIDTEYDNVNYFLHKFVWDRSKKGHYYWSNIYRNINEHINPIYDGKYINNTKIKWQEYDKSIEEMLRKELDVEDKHQIKVLAISDGSPMFSYKTMIEFYESWTGTRSRSGFSIYHLPSKYKKGRGIYFKDGTYVIFKIVKPRGSGKVVSEKMKNAQSKYKEFSNESGVDR